MWCIPQTLAWYSAFCRNVKHVHYKLCHGLDVVRHTTHLLHRLAQLGINSLVLGPQLCQLQWISTDQIGESATTSSLKPSLSEAHLLVAVADDLLSEVPFPPENLHLKHESNGVSLAAIIWVV